MAVDNLSQFLNDSAEREGWELGEAFAEVLLEQDTHRRVLWPWNNARDRKTPRASLPGADLVGFAFDEGDWNLLLGEVKTSSDSNCPPNVMYGKKGLPWQLETNALGKEIQRTLLRWLRMRCTTPETVSAYTLTIGSKLKRLSEREQRTAWNLPARVYYGVNSDRALALRLVGVPRTAAEPLAVELGLTEDMGTAQVREVLRKSDDALWRGAMGEIGAAYRAV